MPQPWLTAPGAPLLQPRCPLCKGPPPLRPLPATLRLLPLQLSRRLQRNVPGMCARADRQTVLPVHFSGRQLKRCMPISPVFDWQQAHPHTRRATFTP